MLQFPLATTVNGGVPDNRVKRSAPSPPKKKFPLAHSLPCTGIALRVRPHVRVHPRAHGQPPFALALTSLSPRIHARASPRSPVPPQPPTVVRPRVNGRPHVTVHCNCAPSRAISALAFTTPPFPAVPKPPAHVPPPRSRTNDVRPRVERRTFLPASKCLSPLRPPGTVALAFGFAMRSLRPRVTVRRPTPFPPVLRRRFAGRSRSALAYTYGCRAPRVERPPLSPFVCFPMATASSTAAGRPHGWVRLCVPFALALPSAPPPAPSHSLPRFSPF
ncbi:hypothetical protein GLOTRDRAFT_99591, partial [Gloeophyllum trabeum ATCC 11539]